ncbi:sugar phosphate nucleotidyltransferase [candidate division KSB1 bacterium]
MQAVIMAGGFGTRLRPLTLNIPKPMIPLMNTPLIGHILKLLQEHKFSEIIVMLFYQPDLIREFLGDGSKFGTKITYLLPDVDLGTAGSVKYAEKFLKDTFLVISGDLITDVDLTEFHKFHKKTGAEASILLTQVPNPLPFGVVITDKDHRISRFLEKPSWGEVFTDRINSGIYMFEPSIFNRIPGNKEYDFGKDFFPKMLKDKSQLFGYPGEGYWKDIGNLDEYLAVHQDCLANKVAVNLEYNREDNISVGKNCKIDKSVELKDNALIGDSVIIHKDAYIQNSVIGNGSIIEQGARIINTILWDNVKIGENAQTKNSVLASRTRLGNASVVSDKGFISEDVVIGNNSLIKPQVKIWPKKNIASDTILSTSLVWGDKWLRELFTEARITGIANKEITPEFAARLGSALGAFWGVGNTVYTSRDNDKTSFMISSAIQSGLISMGVSVHNMNIAPIPVVRQVLSKSKNVGGIQIRRSPYDIQMTDIIVFDSDGLDLHTNKCKKVERLFFGEDYVRVENESFGYLDYIRRPFDVYKEKFLSIIDKKPFSKSKFKIVVDFSFGPASVILPDIIRKLDIDIVPLNAFLGPEYQPFSTQQKEENAKQLCAIVKSLKADAGFIIDPTCERLFLVGNKGRYFENKDLLMIVTKLFIMHSKKCNIGAPVSAPFGIKQMADENGYDFTYCKSTHPSMIETASMKNTGFVGGTRGGFIFTDFSYGADAMFSLMKILEMVASSGKRLAEIIDSISFANIAKIDAACPWDEKGKIMNEIMEETEFLNRDLIHGIKIYNENSWVLLLPGKDEPLFTIIAEASTKKAAAALANTWAKKIDKWRKK